MNQMKKNKKAFKMRLEELILKFKLKIRTFISKFKTKHIPNQIYYIGCGEPMPTPLTREEELKVLENLGKDNGEARQILIKRNLRLVVYVVRKFANSKTSVEDLVSIGTIGLIKAAKTFKSEKNIKFATYASRCIENEVLMELRRTTNSKTEISIHQKLNIDLDGKNPQLLETLKTENDVTLKNIEMENDITLLEIAMSKLPPREKNIIMLRFGMGNLDEKTQKEVADMLGISQSYISRLEKKIINKLNEYMTNMIEE